MTNKDVTNLSLLREANSDAPDIFDIPFEVVKLPSKGLIYTEDHPLANEEEVQIKPMGATEESILFTKAYAKRGTTTSMLIKSCLVNKLIDPTTLLLGDKTAILLAIRISGFGSEYKVSTVCPACKESFVHTFDLRKCTLKYLEEKPVKENTNLFEYVLPVSKAKVEFSLLTDGDDLEISKTEQNRKKLLNQEIDTRTTEELIRMIKSVNGKKDPEYIGKFVSRVMKPLDIRSLKKHANDTMPDIDWEQEVTCKHCGETDLHKILLTSEFFFPTLE